MTNSTKFLAVLAFGTALAAPAVAQQARPMRFIAYVLIGLTLVAGTAAAVAQPAVTAGCNSSTTNC